MTTMCLKLPSGPLSAAAIGPAAMRLIEARVAETRTARSRPLRCFTVPPPGAREGSMRGRYNRFGGVGIATGQRLVNSGRFRCAAAPLRDGRPGPNVQRRVTLSFVAPLNPARRRRWRPQPEPDL